MSKNTILKNFKTKDVLFFGFILIYIINLTQLYFVNSNSVKLNTLIQEEFTKSDDKSLNLTLNSSNNKDVFLKSRLLKIKDEIVLGTSEIESHDLKPTKDQYLNFYSTNKLRNWVLWYECYFGNREQNSNCFK